MISSNTVEGCCIAGIIERGEVCFYFLAILCCFVYKFIKEITVKENVVRVVGGRQHGCTCGIEFYGVNNSTIEKNVQIPPLLSFI